VVGRFEIRRTSGVPTRLTCSPSLIAADHQ